MKELSSIKTTRVITNSIVHDIAEIKAQTKKPDLGQEKLEELLGSPHFDPDGAYRLIQLYSKILRERTEQKRKDSIIQEKKDIKTDDEKLKWVMFTHDDPSSKTEEHQKHNHNSLIGMRNSTRLMNRLLFGDEEMANMVMYQHGYNAAARVVSTMDKMLDTIINRMGV